MTDVPLLVSSAQLYDWAEERRRRGRKIGIVPTMGALHDGHLSLVRRLKSQVDDVVVTVFVNPTQFGPAEDFSKYPRDLDRDVRLSVSAGADALFTPPVSAMYPPGDETRVRVPRVAKHLCGASRPDHFEGVATVVTKLLCAVGPATAIFGRKDYQQLQVIRALVRDLFLPIEVVGAPIVRDADGLALSSRNVYLSPTDRSRALAIPRALSNAIRMHAAGERRVATFREAVSGSLDRALLRVDYVALADPESVQPMEGDVVPDRVLLAVAAFADRTRLIDNVVLGEDPAPEVAES